MILFAIYGLVYLAYVFTQAFAPSLSEWRPFGGLNLAVLWGFGLIGLAFALSLLYGILCVREVE